MKPNKVEAAWSAYYQTTKADDLDALHAVGWKTNAEIIAGSGLGADRTRQRLARDPKLETKLVCLFHGRQFRTVRVYRPKSI